MLRLNDGLHCLIATWCCMFVVTGCSSDAPIEVVTWYWWFVVGGFDVGCSSGFSCAVRCLGFA